jgi:hypothetical protein
MTWFNETTGIDHEGDRQPGDIEILQRTSPLDIWTGTYWDAPGKSPESRRDTIIAQLQEIDAASIRPLRAICCNVSTDADIERLRELNSQSIELREQLKSIV